MKLIITIPEDKYRYIQELEQDNTDYATTRMLYHAVKHGKPYSEQVPKIGHWVSIDEEPHEDYECNRCGYVVSVYTANIEPHTEYKYCPNCGLKMEEGNDKEPGKETE